MRLTLACVAAALLCSPASARAGDRLVLPAETQSYALAGDGAVVVVGVDAPRIVRFDADGRRTELAAFRPALRAYEAAVRRAPEETSRELGVGVDASATRVALVLSLDDEFQDVGPDTTEQSTHSVVLSADPRGGRAHVVERCGITQFAPLVAAGPGVVGTWGGCREDALLDAGDGHRLEVGRDVEDVSLAGRFARLTRYDSRLVPSSTTVDARSGAPVTALPPPVVLAPATPGLPLARGEYGSVGRAAFGGATLPGAGFLDPVTGGVVTVSLPAFRTVVAFDGERVRYLNAGCPGEHTTLLRQTLAELAATGPVPLGRCTVTLPQPTVPVSAAAGTVSVPVRCPLGCSLVFTLRDPSGALLGPAPRAGVNLDAAPATLCFALAAAVRGRLRAGEPVAAVLRAQVEQPDRTYATVAQPLTLRGTGGRACRP